MGYVAKRGHARTTDPETSHEAMLLANVSRLDGVIIRTLESYPDGLISTEVAEISGELLQSVGSRLSKIEAAGYAFRDGSKRMNRNGRNQEVWKHHTYFDYGRRT